MTTAIIAVNRVEGPNEWGFYDIYDQSGKKYSTQDDDLASSASSLVGQVCEWEFETKVKSGTAKDGSPRTYTNHYVRSISAQKTPTLTPTAGQGYEFVTAPPASPQTPSLDDREKRIMRQTASKVAVHLLAFIGPEEQGTAKVIEYANRLVRYYESGE